MGSASESSARPTVQLRSPAIRPQLLQVVRGQIQSATIKDGIATLDVTPGFSLTNNVSTSTLSTFVWGQIDATVFNFPEIQGIELTLDGQRWCGWENTCDGLPLPWRTRP